LRHHQIGVHPAFTREAEAARRQAIAHQPREPRRQFVTAQQDIVSTMGDLDVVVFLENRNTILRGQDKIPLLLESGIGIGPELGLEVAHQLQPEQRQGDVFGRRELLAESTRRTRRARKLVGGIALDDGDRTLEPVFAEIIGRGGADNAAAHDHNVIILHGFRT
jgi:hypothetical protein